MPVLDLTDIPAARTTMMEMLAAAQTSLPRSQRRTPITWCRAWTGRRRFGSGCTSLPQDPACCLAARYGESVYAAVGPVAGADQLSAMPSVHVAWSVIVAWAVITRTHSRWRWLILLHPAVTVFVVVATGNHFWADGIIAATIDATVISAQALLTRRLGTARVPRQASERASSTAASSRQP